MSDLSTATYEFWHPSPPFNLWLGTTDESGAGEGEWWAQHDQREGVLTFKLLMQAFDGWQGRVDDCVVHVAPDVRDAYLNLMTADRRYVNRMVLGGEYQGYTAVEFQGTPLIVNPEVPAGRMYFVNTQRGRRER